MREEEPDGARQGRREEGGGQGGRRQEDRERGIARRTPPESQRALQEPHEKPRGSPMGTHESPARLRANPEKGPARVPRRAPRESHKNPAKTRRTSRTRPVRAHRNPARIPRGNARPNSNAPQRHSAHMDGQGTVATFWIHLCKYLFLHGSVHIVFKTLTSMYASRHWRMRNALFYNDPRIFVYTPAQASVVDICGEGPPLQPGVFS